MKANGFPVKTQQTRSKTELPQLDEWQPGTPAAAPLRARDRLFLPEVSSRTRTSLEILVEPRDRSSELHSTGSRHTIHCVSFSE